MALILFLVFVATAVAQTGCLLDAGTAERIGAAALTTPAWIDGTGAPLAGVTTDSLVGGVCHIRTSTLALLYTNAAMVAFDFPGLNSITTTGANGISLAGGVTGFSAPLLSSVQGNERAIFVSVASSLTSFNVPLLATAEQVITTSPTILFQFSAAIESLDFPSLNSAGANPLELVIESNGALTCLGLPNIPSTTIGRIDGASIVLTVPGAGAPCTKPAGLAATVASPLQCGDAACCAACLGGQTCISNVCVGNTPSGVTFTPATGPDTGGTVVTISGVELNLVTDVQFGSGNSAAFTAAATDGDDITATSPANAAVDVDLILVFPDKKRATSNLGTFTYVAAVGPTE